MYIWCPFFTAFGIFGIFGVVFLGLNAEKIWYVNDIGCIWATEYLAEFGIPSIDTLEHRAGFGSKIDSKLWRG